MRTQKQIEEYQAMVQLVQIGITKVNEVIYKAPSQTESADHILTVNPTTGEAQSCTCKWFCEGGWTRGLKDGTCHKCAHAIATENYIEAAKAAVESVVEDEEEVLSAEETAELVALLNGPKVGPFSSINEMVAAMHAVDAVAEAVEIVHEVQTTEVTCRHCNKTLVKSEAIEINPETSYYRCPQCAYNVHCEDKVAMYAEFGIRCEKPEPCKVESKADYIRMRDGGLVQKSAQRRYRQRGSFSLYR